jgi:outer membrane receptor protein involved in Fe transport
VPGTPSADNYQFNVFGATFPFPASIALTEGNPALRSEEAETLTFGTVISFERVTLAIDWYDIDLTDAIEAPSFAAVYQQCMDPTYNALVASPAGSVTGPQLTAGNPFCNLINREYIGNSPAEGATGGPRTFEARYLNLGGITSSGLDVQLDWRFDVGSAGMLNLGVRTTFLDEYSETAFAGSTPVDYTGTTFNSSFDYKAFTTLRYDATNWSLGLRWQHLPGLDPDPATPAFYPVKAHDQIDLFGRWSISERYQLRAGIDNVTNADPEVVGASATNNALGSTSTDYDGFGRRFFLGLQISM